MKWFKGDKWFRDASKDKDVKIINTGANLGEPTIEQELRFLSERDRFIPITIEKQTRRTGNIIYGCQAVNKQVKPEFRRDTSDYDIYSKQPRKHALELEQSIDNHVKADIAQVKQVGYERDSEKGKMYRVELKNFDNIADYNPTPSGMKCIIIDGIRYQRLGDANKKYIKMIKDEYMERLPKATQDIDRIHLNKYWRKVF